MQNNKYSSLINFKVKLHRQRLFFFFINEHNVGGSNFLLNIVNMVSHGVFYLEIN